MSYSQYSAALINWWHRPFPFSDEWPSLRRQVVFSGLFVALFLFIFRPFGLYQFGMFSADLLRICSQYGLITAGVAVLFASLIRGFPNYFNDRQWTVGKEVLHSLVFIAVVALANLIYSAWKFKYDGLSLKIYFIWLGLTAAVGMFPTIIGVALRQNRLLRRYSEEAEQINTEIQSGQHGVADQEAKLVLSGDNQGEELSIALSAIRYVEAADNYVSVVWLDEGTRVRTTLLRGTLKRFEADLANHQALYRCHRAYIVHLGHVTRLSGNAQGYKLHLADISTTLPVSRSLNELIRTRLTHLQPQ
jgi:LytTr DNA-binding domain